jgi:isoquinoline 1-oxidoreductase
MPELERYELREFDLLPAALTRREFAGILILIAAAGNASGQRGESGSGRRQPVPQDVGAWLHIAEDGTVTVYTGKAEVGQNTRTALAQAVADELLLPLDSVRMVMADTELTPYDAGTFGSQSTPQMSPQLRRAGAAAREALIGLAAEKWQVDRASVAIRDGKLQGPSGRQAGFGEMTKGAKLQRAIQSDIATKQATEWTVAGRSLPKMNGRDFVTGRHKYASDISVPGMQYGKVLRAEAAGAKLTALDVTPAEHLQGVKVVRDGEFTGVTAADAATAAAAVSGLKAEWQTSPQPGDAVLFEHLKKNAREPRGANVTGDARQALAAAEARIERSYTVAYIAHAPLETRTAVAQMGE